MYHYTVDGDSTDGSWAYRRSRFADRQLHIVLFWDGPDTTEVYAHDEYNWLRHPVKHAREVDIRREAGSAEMRRWLDANGIPYDSDSHPVRKVKHTVDRIRERFTGRFMTPSKTLRSSFGLAFSD